MVSLDTPDIILNKFLVSCLVSIFITEDVASVLGDCYVCDKPLELDQVGILDWQERLLLCNPNLRKTDSCVSKYQEQYLKINPNTTIMQMMIQFGISRSTVSRRRAKVGSGK